MILIYDLNFYLVLAIWFLVLLNGYLFFGISKIWN